MLKTGQNTLSFYGPYHISCSFLAYLLFFHGSRKRKSLRCLFCKKKQWCKYVTYQVVKTIAFYSTCPTMLRGLFVPTVLPLHERQHHVTHKWCKFLTTKSSSRRHIFPFCCCSCCCYSVLFSLQFNSRTHCQRAPRERFNNLTKGLGLGVPSCLTHTVGSHTLS